MSCSGELLSISSRLHHLVQRYSSVWWWSCFYQCETVEFASGLCVCGEKKKVCVHSSRFLVFLLEQMYLVLLKQLVLPFVFCHYNGCQPPGHWLPSLIILKKISFPLSAASSYVLDLSVIKGKPWMCFQATTLASQFLGKQHLLAIQMKSS